MMESCLVGKLERVGPVTVDDIRRDLLDEFSALPAADSVHSQSENLQVYLRVRPFTAAESDSGEPQDCVTIEGPDTVILRAPRTSQSNRQSEKLLSQTAQRFTFTQVFGPDASQRKVFEGSVRNLVQDVLEGGNCLVFTYGVTNAGKTFTFLGPEHDGGLLPRSLAVIFNSIESRLYGRCDLKPQRCRDFSRLTPDQQASEMSNKKNLMRLLKETDRNQMSGRSTFLDGSSLSSNGSINSISEAESFCLDVNSNIRFSIWVSFCEIYNDNIHDLLEQVSIGQNRRTVLRLSQDVKGNSFIKDLRWVQVNSAEEAYRVMKIGRKNQSFSATRLNQLSSRSHSIFSIRILRVDDIGVPRVLGISELALCDLAGSERCSRTHNTGERLKEAGNINNSLLTLGKCISAMRLNQNSKFQHHIPFRESKLTHFLQFFFCGAGRVSMVVNINQNSSCVDETLNVLKFSALAQKVVMVNTRPVVLDEAPTRSAMELSMIIDEAEQRRNGTGRGRKSSLVAWETSLEDVLEDEDGEEEDDDNDESMMEGTVLEAGREEDEDDSDQTMEEEEGSDRDAALRLVLEAQIREEVSAEFMELFNKMEKDYSDRLEKEREMLEERAERRVEILKNLVSKTVNMSSIDTNDNKEEQVALLEGIISSMSQDLEKIKADAQSVHRCLTEQAQAAELETLRLEKQNSQDQLQEASENLEKQQQKLSELMEMCQQKDGIINTLQAAMDRAAEESTRDREVVETIRTELLQLQQNCHCLRTATGSDEKGERKRQRDAVQDEGEGERGPAKKRVLLEEEIWRLQEENERKEQTIIQLREKEGRLIGQEEELRKQEEELRRREQQLLTGATQEECPHCDTILSSLDSERRDISRLTKENKALVNGIFQLQTQVTRLQEQHGEQNQQLNSKVEQLTTTKDNLLKLERQTDEKDTTIKCLTQEVECLRQKIKKEETERCASSTVYRTAMEELKKESQVALESSSQKTQQIQDLKIEKEKLQAQLNHSESRCEQLREELASQRADYINKLQSLRSELESEDAAQRMKEEEMQKELKAILSEKETLLQDSLSQIATLRRELERLQKELQQQQEEEKENQVMQGTKLTVVEELKEEMQRHQRKKELQRKQQHGEEERTFEAVRRELECHTQKVLRSGGRVLSPDVHLSPLRSNTAVSKKTPKTRKRKSCEVGDLVCSENKRNRQRGNTRNCKQDRSSHYVRIKDKTEETLQKKIGDLIHNSPSILGKTAKTIIGFVSEHTVTTTTKPKRGRRKLYKTEVSSPMLVSPICAGGDDEKESDHQIIKRQLRSKTCKK